jgi:hypothetical protein
MWQQVTSQKNGILNYDAVEISGPTTWTFQEVKVPRLYDNGTGWW